MQQQQLQMSKQFRSSNRTNVSCSNSRGTAQICQTNECFGHVMTIRNPTDCQAVKSKRKLYYDLSLWGYGWRCNNIELTETDSRWLCCTCAGGW